MALGVCPFRQQVENCSERTQFLAKALNNFVTTTCL